MKKLKDISKKEIREIAEYYASSEVSRSYFIKKYNISSSTFYKILDKAVIEHIVSEKIANMMMNRAITNTKEKLKNDIGVNRSYLHYNDLLEKRRSFIFSKKIRIELLKEFSQKDSRESKSEFCNNHFFDIELLDKILIFSTINNEIPKKVYTRIKDNSFASTFNNEATTIFFNILEKFRNNNDNLSDIYHNVHKLYINIYNLVYSNRTSS